MQSLMTVPVTLSSFSNAALCQRTPRSDGLGDGDENADLSIYVCESSVGSVSSHVVSLDLGNESSNGRRLGPISLTSLDIAPVMKLRHLCSVNIIRDA